MALLAVTAGRAEMEFAGYIVRIGDVRFMLADPTVPKMSGWLAVGEAFDGYTVVEFDWKADTLVVEKAGERRRLRLPPGRREGVVPSLEVAEELVRRSVKLGDAILNMAGGTGILFLDVEAAQKRLERQEKALEAVRVSLAPSDENALTLTPERRTQLKTWEEALVREVAAARTLLEEKQRRYASGGVATLTPAAGEPKSAEQPVGQVETGPPAQQARP
jgi:hypothetical protein